MGTWPKPDTLWYFADGSNMSAAKFTGGRGIVPLDAIRVRIPGWQLVMEIPGLPYSEPCFSCDPDVTGVAYLITTEQYRAVIASEGGGIAYNDISVIGEPIFDNEKVRLGSTLMVRTLGTAMVRHPCPRPSTRYLGIMVEGAKEAKLAAEYQQYLAEVPAYTPPRNWWGKLGAWIFLNLWGPVMAVMERISNANMRSDGYTQPWVIWLVRLTMIMIWGTHDWIFMPLFGHGDGLGEEYKAK